MAEDPRGVPIKVKVHDKRRTNKPAADERDHREPDAETEATSPAPTSEATGQPDYLADLQRLQAEFDNYRKRMMKEQTVVTARATGRIVEGLLPVLDNFERAIEHGEGGPGVQMVFRELKDKLAAEGLEEIEALDVPFDPRVHEAVESVEDEGVTEPVCREVYRRGYRFKERLLRPATVVVAHPPESADADVAGEPGNAEEVATPQPDAAEA